VIEAKKEGATLPGSRSSPEVHRRASRYASRLVSAAALCLESTGSRPTSPTASTPTPRARNVFAFIGPTFADILNRAGPVRELERRTAGDYGRPSRSWARLRQSELPTAGLRPDHGHPDLERSLPTNRPRC